MASNVTRDHHNLRRNLKLNGNYISNDGGDEGISIADDGDITLTSNDTQLKIAYDATNYATHAVAADGALTITTVDADGAEAVLTLNIDGKIDINSAVSENITLDSGGSIILDAANGVFNFYDALDLNDYFKIVVAGSTGVTTLSTISEHDDGHLNIEADGHVEFDGCAVGFAQIEEAFSDDTLLTTGGTHDTQIDFRASNKIYLSVTATMNDMNLIFPAVSGNFLLLVTYDGDWAIDSWKAWESDLTAATQANVFWPGGTEPATTDSGRDIFSFYWDAENQICYGVASLDFQAGN